MEYDWFYLESEVASFVFRASSSATGDAPDSVNIDPVGSRVNGSPFVMTGGCANSVGPWWYSNPGSCCYSRLFGSSSVNGGFFWNGNTVGNLKSARMMIRLA